MNVLCKHCNTIHFTAEKVFNKGNSCNDCCGHGSVELESIRDFPAELRLLFENHHVKGRVHVFGITIVRFRLHP